jgi:hypothetical protein
MCASNNHARQIVRALRGQWHGKSGIAHCPTHSDRVPSLSVSNQDDRVLVYCHAGCDQSSVISALCTLGLWPTRKLPAGRIEIASAHKADARVTGCLNRDHAVQMWLATFRGKGTLVERYLHHRGLQVPVPPSLRFMPHLLHAPTGQYFPVVVAGIQAAGGTICAIQRVFIRSDGLGKAEVTLAKMSLGSLGDGAVRLGEAGEIIGLCEGWETGLAAMQIFRLPVWCSLSAGRMHRVALPANVRRIVIFADNDPPGRKAAERTARLQRQHGRLVEILWPVRGADFNDELILAGQR